jgi:AcrR family transcriptional regulator
MGVVVTAKMTKKGLSTRDNILDEAIKIASRDGLEGLTIGTLAERVGMSKSGLFAHFKSKDALQLSVLERAADLFTTKVLMPAFKESRGEPRILALFENWIRFLNDEGLPGGSIFVAASFELDDRPGVLRDYVQKAQRDLIENLEKSAEFAIEEGHFSRSVDVGHFAWTLYSFVLGYHHSKRMIEDPNAESHLRAAFQGLLSACKSKTAVQNKIKKRA